MIPLRFTSTLTHPLVLSLALYVMSAPVVFAEKTDTLTSAVQKAQPVGQEALDVSVFPGLANTLSLDLRGMDVVEVLKFLATKGELNIATSPEVQGRVSLILNNVSVRDAMEIILVSNGLAVERRANILYVMSGQVYEQLYGRRYGDPRQSRIIQLKYANPGQVGALLSNMKSSVGRIVVDEPTATIAMLDVPEVLSQMQALIDRVDLPTIQRQVPTQTRVIPLAYADAEKVKAEVDQALTPDIGSARLDKRSNALVVTEVPARMPMVEQLIKAFDAKHRQVYLEATILQVTLKDEFDIGIEWQWFSESKKFPDVTLIQSLPIGTDVNNPMKLIFGTVAENDITATIKALHNFGDTKILSSPHISAMNNEEAKILVGKREAFITSTVTQAQSTATTAESVQFVDVGVKLYVTPAINELGYITMKIRPEVSSVTSTLKTASGNTIPIVETSEAETKVMVKDGVTLVIGGLMKDETIKNQQRIPLLADIPILGAVFRNTSDRIKKTELVILLTPRIISGEEFVAPSSPTRIGQMNPTTLLHREQ